jgi:hypothetical protein
MPRFHFDVPADLASEIARRTEARGLSVSQFLAEVVRREIATGWPDGFFEEVLGGWRGEPLERPQRLSGGDRGSHAGGSAGPAAGRDG